MKNLIFIIVFLTMSCTTANAQIKKAKTNTKLSTKTNINIFKGNKPVVNKGLRISNIESLTPSKINNLSIPKYNIPLAKLNARAVRTWKITPEKQYDGNLKLEIHRGVWRREAWEIGSYKDLPSRYGTDILSTHVFPLFIKFGASARAEYRLKIKFDNSGNRSNPLYISANSYVSIVNLNRHGEANYFFTTDSTRPIDIYISAIEIDDESNLIRGVGLAELQFAKSYISEVRIDRIDN